MIKTGSYVGNGSKQFIALDFVPDWIVVKGGGTIAAQRFPDSWVQRTVTFTAAGSFSGGILRKPKKKGFWVGSNAAVNTLGTTYYYLAVATSASAPMTDMSWMGNGLAGHMIPLRDGFTPAACIVKRDGTPQAAWCSSPGTTIGMGDGATIASAVSAFSAGSITVGTALNVNELSPPPSGEAHDGIFFAQGSALKVGSWTGDGTASRIISLPIAPKAMVIQPAGSAAHLATDVMGGASGPVDASALAAGAAALGPGASVTVSAALNASGIVYSYVAVADHFDSKPEEARPVTAGRKAVLLYSREILSLIHCGSDNSLKPATDNLPISMEWFGALEWLDTNRSSYGALMLRGGGNQLIGDVANSHQSGLVACAPDEQTLGWGGPQIGVIVADRYYYTGDVRKMWRTGIFIPPGEYHHWIATGDGNGLWHLYRDGVLVKHRNIDMRTSGLALANTKALSSRPMVIGAADSNGVTVGSQRMYFISARQYSVELTAAQALARYQREALGMTNVADVATGLVEEWRAENAHGGILPATANAANNGTIIGGVVLTL